MAQPNQGFLHFLTHWFSGLIDGLESLDRPAREAILRQCGKACAQSYTAELFQRASEESRDADEFLILLAASFPEATYERLPAGDIRVRYSHCACDLVTQGLVESPLICRCSAYNLQENFERAWGVPVHVRLERSILTGAPDCAFIVTPESPV